MAVLSRVALIEQFSFPSRDVIGQRKVRVRTSQIAVPLRDLVGEAELVAECRRHQLADGPVILVRIAGGRGEHEIRAQRPRLGLDDLLDLAPDGGQPPVGQVMQLHLEVRAGCERPGRRLGLLLALTGPRQQDVPDTQPRVALSEAEQGPARCDLNVIGMRADREDRQRRVRRRVKAQRQHYATTAPGPAAPTAPTAAVFPAPERSGSHTIQGQLPWWYISSSWARSFTVSAGVQ